MGGLLDLVRELGIDKPIGSMVNPTEVIEFIEFLPDLEWWQAYVVLVLVRSKGLKELYGFKGSDFTLGLKAVVGALSNPKLRLYQVLRRYSVVREYSDQCYLYEKGGRYYRIPKDLVCIMVCPNPADWVTASIDTVKEFMDSMRESIISGTPSVLKRIDVRLAANCMRRTKAYFHMIDIDSHEAVNDVLMEVQELLSYLPARIVTPHGMHVLVPVHEFDKETARRWFRNIDEVIDRINLDYGGGAVEYKKVFQEPVPGIEYRGIIPKFLPPEK